MRVERNTNISEARERKGEIAEKGVTTTGAFFLPLAQDPESKRDLFVDNPLHACAISAICVMIAGKRYSLGTVIGVLLGYALPQEATMTDGATEYEQ